MSHNHITLLLGTNLGDKKNNLLTAITLINQEIGKIINHSEIIETQPEEYDSENTFLNQTIEMITTGSPITILNKVKEIEKIMGRKYLNTSQRYQDRIIDIDLLFFNNVIFDCQTLKIPHPQIFSRNFINLLLNCNLEK